MVNIKKELKKGKRAYEEAQRKSDPRNDPRFKVSKEEEIRHKKKSEEELKKPLARTMGLIVLIAVIIVMMWTKTGIGHLINFDMFR